MVGDLHQRKETERPCRKERPGMSIHRWSQDVILVDLPRELEKHNELRAVIGMLRDRGDCDVVVDFSHVDVVGGECLARLLEMRRLLNGCGRKLTLSSV